MSKSPSVKIGDTFTTNNYGTCTVIAYTNSKNILVKFDATGYEFNTAAHNLKSGMVKDLLAPKHYGIGFIGEGDYTADGPAYTAWADMLKRCYSPKYHAKQPTYRECSVAVEWHNFQNFATWYYINVPKQKVALDKDALVKGNRVYSPTTCKFLTHQENSEISIAKQWEFRTPTGDMLKVFNLNKFCKHNDLGASAMSKVHRGILKQHKGWTRCV